MQKITPIDVQHKTFKKALQGYDRTEVDQFLDEIIEALEDEATHRAALEAEIADLRERISHFKAMEDSLQNTLLLAQRTADEVKASAHKEADLIKEQARLASEREIASYNDAVLDVRREHQRAIEAAEKAKSELRSLLMTHLSLLENAHGMKKDDTAVVAPQAPPPAAPAISETSETSTNETTHITVS